MAGGQFSSSSAVGTTNEDAPGGQFDDGSTASSPIVRIDAEQLEDWRDEARAWAVGTDESGGEITPDGNDNTPDGENNAKYWAEQAQAAADEAGATTAIDLSNVEADLSTLQGEVTDLDGRVSTLETDVSALGTPPDMLDDLSDVNTAGVTMDQVLSWNGINWVPADQTGGTTFDISTVDLDDLRDVSTTTPNDGQVLTWSGSEWAPAAPTGGGGSSTLSGLTDTDLTGLGDGDLLAYNQTNMDWEPFTLPADMDTVPGTLTIGDGTNRDALDLSADHTLDIVAGGSGDITVMLDSSSNRYTIEYTGMVGGTPINYVGDPNSVVPVSVSGSTISADLTTTAAASIPSTVTNPVALTVDSNSVYGSLVNGETTYSDGTNTATVDIGGDVYVGRVTSVSVTNGVLSVGMIDTSGTVTTVDTTLAVGTNFEYDSALEVEADDPTQRVTAVSTMEETVVVDVNTGTGYDATNTMVTAMDSGGNSLTVTVPDPNNPNQVEVTIPANTMGDITIETETTTEVDSSVGDGLSTRPEMMTTVLNRYLPVYLYDQANSADMGTAFPTLADFVEDGSAASFSEDTDYTMENSGTSRYIAVASQDTNNADLMFVIFTIFGASGEFSAADVDDSQSRNGVSYRIYRFVDVSDGAAFTVRGRIQ